MDILLFVLLVTGLVLLGISWFKSELTCDPPKIIYKYVPASTLDVQFNNENFPSQIYNDMFTQSSPWIGGFTLGNGKTYAVQQAQKSSKP